MNWDFRDLEKIRTQGKKIVFTNGCFDIIHTGHIAYLKQARQLGDILVVGLDSDQSVKQLKGHGRPIHNQDERKFLIENLKPVDLVYIFDNGDPLPLIKLVKPDFLVKGGDWAVEKIIGHDFVTQNGGRVLSLPFVEGKSTTQFIKDLQGKQ